MPVIVSGRDLDEPVPKLGPPDVLLGLIAADVALEHHVAVVGGADDLPAVLGELVEEIGDLGEALRGLGNVLAQPPRICARDAVGSIELVPDLSDNLAEYDSRD